MGFYQDFEEDLQMVDQFGLDLYPLAEVKALKKAQDLVLAQVLFQLL